MIVIPKFLLFVMTTATATAVAADSSSSSSSSTLATKLVIEEEKSMLNNEAWASTTTTTPEGFAAMLLSSSSSSSLVEVEVSVADGDDDSAQRKLSKSSKKVKHPAALCTLSLFADSVFMYGNQCFDDIMVTISACEDTDDTCYISERLPLLSQDENQEEEQCFVGGAFPAKQNIRYNPSTGDCEFLYVDLTDDACNMYTDDDGAGSLGLKARINVKTNLDVMFIQFTKDMGLSFYNAGDERVAVRSTSPKNRYLHQEGETKPLLSMGPHPHRRRRRRMTDCKTVCTSTAEGLAEMKHNIEELESKIQQYENERLLVQITGRDGRPIYGEKSLKDGSFDHRFDHRKNFWSINIDNVDDAFSCPFDEESITQLEIRVGGTVLQKEFLGGADDRYQSHRYTPVRSKNCDDDDNSSALCFQIHSWNPDNNGGIESILAHIGLATASSTSIDDTAKFSSLKKSFLNVPPNYYFTVPYGTQVEEMLHHFDTLINVNDERGEGTKLILTFDHISFDKDSISGAISLIDKLRPTVNCASDYGSNVPCCGHDHPNPVAPHYQCSQSRPTCVNYIFKGLNNGFGTCE